MVYVLPLRKSLYNINNDQVRGAVSYTLFLTLLCVLILENVMAGREAAVAAAARGGNGTDDERTQGNQLPGRNPTPPSTGGGATHDDSARASQLPACHAPAADSAARGGDAQAQATAARNRSRRQGSTCRP
jgi:hypothetical protein